MQQGTTILQTLTLQPSISISDPATPDGKLWNSALKPITQSPGWSQLHWGTQLASQEIVDLLITWKSNADLQSFMAHNYHSFLTAIEPLLPSHDADPQSIQSPYILHLHPGTPTLELGAVTSLYDLTFTPPPTANLKTELGIEAQLCRNFLLDAAQEIANGDLFLGMDAVWISQYEPIIPPTTPNPTTKIEPKHPPPSLLLITSWATPAAEHTILSSGTIEESGSGQLLTTGEYVSRNLLARASAYSKREVMFENVSAVNVEWLDREEKWSTYVARLLAEEEDRKEREEGAESTISGVD